MRSTRERTPSRSSPSCPDAVHVSFGAPTWNGRWVTLNVTTAKAPTTSYVFDWQTQKLVQWVMPSTPEIDTSKFAVASLETYPARDGTKIPMFVRRPAGCEKPAARCPVARALPRRARRAGPPGLQHLRADLRRRRLRVRRAQRARQRRLRQGVAPRRRRPEAPPGDHRHRGRVEVRAQRVGARGQGAEGRHHGRQLRRLLDARGHDDVRGRVRRGRRERRHVEPAHVPPEHGAVSTRPADERVRRSRRRIATRSSSSRRSRTSRS